MNPVLAQQLDAIDWSEYDTAYGPATEVPDSLRKLLSDDHAMAMKASHKLWCGLCHQHAYVSSAALPALPFILHALDQADQYLAIEILDIFVGFAVCTNPKSHELERWERQLRESLQGELPRFHRLATSPNEEIADFAQRIAEDLAFVA